METATRTMPQEFRYIDTTTARVILVQGGTGLLKGMPEAMGRRALKDLQEMGVEVRLNSRVTSVDTEGVYVGEDRVLAENVFWAAGVKGTAIAHTLGVELNRQGQIFLFPAILRFSLWEMRPRRSMRKRVSLCRPLPRGPFRWDVLRPR